MDHVHVGRFGGRSREVLSPFWHASVVSDLENFAGDVKVALVASVGLVVFTLTDVWEIWTGS